MVAAGVGRTFQNIRLFQNMTALENVLVGHAPEARRQPRRRAMFNTQRMQREEEAALRPRAGAARAGRPARARATSWPRNLPYGDQRRLEIARALASDPRLLLLDEPAAGMNPKETQDLMALISQAPQRTSGSRSC